MKSVKVYKVTSIPFAEGTNLPQTIPYQFTQAVRKMFMTLSGTITIASTSGTVAPTMVQNSPLSLWPYLLALFGNVTFQGTRLDSGKGFKMNSVPATLLWFRHFMETGVPLPVSDGGMLAAGFAAGTYNVSICVPVDHFDAKLPKKQHSMSYFRPPCYNKQPFFQIEGGTLFQAGVTGTQLVDNVAITGETATPATLVYTLNLNLTCSVELVPDLKISGNDLCADRSYEYIPIFNATPAGYNNNALADLEIQQYIDMISTDLIQVGGSSTALVEQGSAGILGAANNGIIETDFGTQPISRPYAVDLVPQNVVEFMTGGYALPVGEYCLDEYGHDLSEWQKKTCLQPGLATHFVNGFGIPNSAHGSNFRILHSTLNLSQSAKRSVGTFPPFAGA